MQICKVVSFVCLISGCLLAQGEYRILRQACVLGEVERKDAGKWIALFFPEANPNGWSSNQAFLDEVEVKIVNCNDGLFGKEQRPDTNHSKKNILKWYIRGLKNPKQFPIDVHTAKWNTDYHITSKHSMVWYGIFNEIKFSIYTFNASGKSYVFFRWGGSRQCIIKEKLFQNGVHLSFIGDIDGDKKPDIILSASQNENGSRWRLFLSSEAQGNELVHQVAQLSEAGE